MRRLKARYLAGGLVVTLVACVATIVLLSFKHYNLGVSLKYEEQNADAVQQQQQMVTVTLTYLKWATAIVLLLLTALLTYRWLIKPSVHQPH